MPNGKFLILAGTNGAGADGKVRSYSINQSTGELTAAGLLTHNGAAPFAMAVSANSLYAFVYYIDDGALCGYSVDGTTGALAQINCVTPSNSTVAAMAVSNNDNKLYVSGWDAGMELFNIAIDGTLSTGSTVSLPGSTTGISQAMARFENHLFVATSSGVISTFAISTDGSLGTPAQMTVAGYTAAGNEIDALAVSPSGDYLFVNDYLGKKINSFTIDDSANLTQAATAFTDASILDSPRTIAVIQH